MNDPEADGTLEAFLQDFPEARCFQDDPFLAAVDGDGTWNVTDPIDRAHRLFAMANRLRIDALAQQLDQLSKDAKVVAAARTRWRYFGRAQTNLAFHNELGNVAVLPERLARVLHEGNRLNLTLVEDSLDIVFKRGSQVLASIPKSLFVHLSSLLPMVPWDEAKPRRDNSRSRPPNGTPTVGQIETRGQVDA